MRRARSHARVRLAGLVLGASVALGMAGCRSGAPLATVERVDLERYMGDWYVIASIPIGAERNSYNGVESYRRNPDGSIATTYTFRDGAFDGPARRYTPTGHVRNTASNAEWGMDLIWPLRSEYLITYLAEDYSAAIVARSARDYAWILARAPNPSDEQVSRWTKLLAAQGYDPAKVRRVPQRW